MFIFYIGGGVTALALIAWGIIALVDKAKEKVERSIEQSIENNDERAKLIADSIREASGNSRPLSYEEFQEMKRKAKEDPSYAKYLKSQGIDVSE